MNLHPSQYFTALCCSVQFSHKMLLLSVCLLGWTVVIFSGSGLVGGAVLVVVVVVVVVVVDGVGIVVSVGAAEVGPFSVTDVRVCAAEGF